MNEAMITACLENSADAPAAIVLREYLSPVEGRDGVFFPPTFAAAENSREFPGGYNINEFANGENVCIVDTPGSQANRIEPVFMTSDCAQLVPQIVITAGSKKINLLEAGHRAADAIVRCSELRADLQSAFRALQEGDAMPLAKLAPTSLVFGVWDSRDTQAKSPRLLSASIRAFNVLKLTRSAQYNPATSYVEEGLIEETDDKAALNALSERGFRHVPASWTHGGVIARGDIRREVTVQLAALRLLRAKSEDETRKLRAYLLGLALVACTVRGTGFLRQGCNLVLDEDRKPESTLVRFDGRREGFSLTPEEALVFAKKAANAFGVGEGRPIAFDVQLAQEEISGGRRRAASKAPKTTASSKAKAG